MELTKYQDEGVRWLRQRLFENVSMTEITPALTGNSALLCDEPGVGKTAQAIAVSKLLSGRILIVCPSSVKYNWLRELVDWEAETDPTRVTVVPTQKFPDAKYVIINYDLLHRFRDLLAKHSWAMVIFDEAHYLKNPKSLRSKAARIISARSKRLLLTGTIMENHPKEALDLIAWAERWTGSETWSAYQRYLAPEKSRMGYWVYPLGNIRHKALGELLHQHVLRRTKREVLPELPRVRYRLIEIDGANDNKRLKEAEQFKETVKKLGFQKAILGLDHDTWQDSTMDKLMECVGFIKDQLEGGKVVVFAHHRKIIEHLEGALKDYGPIVLTGETPAKDRTERVEWFQTYPVHRVFIGNVKAAGVGITLTAASTIVFVEYPYSPSQIEQCVSRCDRMGQPCSINAFFLCQRNSFDVSILEAVIKKAKSIKEVLDSPRTEV